MNSTISHSGHIQILTGGRVILLIKFSNSYIVVGIGKNKIASVPVKIHILMNVPFKFFNYLDFFCACTVYQATLNHFLDFFLVFAYTLPPFRVHTVNAIVKCFIVEFKTLTKPVHDKLGTWVWNSFCLLKSNKTLVFKHRCFFLLGFSYL